MRQKILISSVALILLVIGAYSIHSDSGRTTSNSNKKTAWDVALIEGNDAYARFEVVRAREAYQRSLQAAEQIWGKDSQQAGVSYNKLGLLSKEENDLEHAEEFLRESWRIADDVLDDTDPRKGYALGDYGKVLQLQHRFDEAVRLYERGVDLANRAKPVIWRDLARAKLDLAELYARFGKMQASGELVEHAFQDFERELSAPKKSSFDNTIRAKAASSFVFSIMDLGEYKKAEPFARRAVSLNEEVFGKESLETSKALQALGIVYRQLGQIQKAEKAYKAAVNALKGEQKKSWVRAVLFSNLAWLAHDRGDTKGTVKLAELALDEAIGHFGRGRAEVCYFVRLLAGFLIEEGDTARANELADLALELALADKVNDRPDLIGSARIFTFARLASKRGNEVLPRLSKIAKVAYQGSSTFHIIARVDMLSAFANMAKLVGDIAMAKEFQAEALSLVPQNSDRAIDVALYSAGTAVHEGNLGLAAELASKALQAAVKSYPGSRKHVWALREIGNIYRLQKKVSHSVDSYRQALDLVLSTPRFNQDYALKIALLGELSAAYKEKGDQEDLLFEILKIYRTAVKQYRFENSYLYMARLSELSQLASKFKDLALEKETLKELMELRAQVEQRSNAMNDLLTLLREELLKQRMQIVTIAKPAAAVGT